MSDLDIYWEPVGFSNCYSGIYQSAKSLFLGLKDHGQKVEVLSDKKFAFSSTVPPKGGVFHKYISPIYSHFLLQKKIFQNKNLRQKQIIFHAHANFNLPVFVPKVQGVRYVLTVHDLIPIISPESVSKKFYLQFLWGLSLAVKKADKIIVVSEWTKKTLVEHFPKVEKKVFVIANSVNGFLNHEKPRKNFKEKKHLDLLYVSRYEHYKRFSLLGDILDQDPRLRLRVVCDELGRKFLYKTHKKQINKGSLNVFVGVSNQQLENLYLKTDVYIHPSLYEGFCLPVRDALLFKVPVVYSLGSAVEELVSDRGIGLEQECGAQKWVQAIFNARQVSVSVKCDFNYDSSLDAAKKLIAVYNSK